MNQIKGQISKIDNLSIKIDRQITKIDNLNMFKMNSQIYWVDILNINRQINRYLIYRKPKPNSNEQIDIQGRYP